MPWTDMMGTLRFGVSTSFRLHAHPTSYIYFSLGLRDLIPR